MTKAFSLCLLVAMAGCSNVTTPTPAAPVTVAPPTPDPAAPVMVSVLSHATGTIQSVLVAATDPQPPSCAWRDLVVAKHIALGGRTNDIVTLANAHQVFIQDTFKGYLLVDYPTPWCGQ